MKQFSSALLGIALAVSAPATAFESQIIRSEYQAMQIERIATGFEHPWAIALLPDGGALITERPGRLSRLDASGQQHEVSGLPAIEAIRQGGLLDVILHPDYESNALVYITYVAETGRDNNGQTLTSTTLARARLNGQSLADFEVLFQDSDPAPPGRHYGSRLAWLPDGTLLMSIGDRGINPPRAQDLGDYAGTLLRLNADGSVPQDNPFLDHAYAKPEIFAYGLRNIQGLWVDADNGDIWASDHGPRGGDELNLIVAGGNYGWPTVSLGRDYRTQAQFGDSVRSKEGMIDPLVDWTPSIAPSGLTRVSGEHWPRWDGNIISGGLRSEQLRRVVFENGIAVHEEPLITGLIGRIRDVRTGPDGSLWVVTDQADGAVYRISPAG